MRAALWLLAIFALAVAVTLLARFDEGYVIVVFPPWRVELSFMLAFLLLCGLVVVSYILIRLGGVALSLSDDMRAWRARRAAARADGFLHQAMRTFLAGNYREAKELALKAEGCAYPELARAIVSKIDGDGADQKKSVD
jgi:HemY protein